MWKIFPVNDLPTAPLYLHECYAIYRDNTLYTAWCYAIYRYNTLYTAWKLGSFQHLYLSKVYSFSLSVFQQLPCDLEQSIINQNIAGVNIEQNDVKMNS